MILLSFGKEEIVGRFGRGRRRRSTLLASSHVLRWNGYFRVVGPLLVPVVPDCQAC